MKKVLSIALSVIILLAIVPVGAFASSPVGSMYNPKVITFGENYSGGWNRNTDHLNYYISFTTTQKGLVSFEFTKPYDNEGEIGAVKFFLYDSDGNCIWSHYSDKEKDAPKPTTKYTVGLEAGEYLVNVTPSFFVESGYIGFDYSFSFAPETYCETEPNNIIPEATTANFGVFYKGALGTYSIDDGSDEFDYFKISVIRDQKYRVRFKNIKKLEPSYAILMVIMNGEEIPGFDGFFGIEDRFDDEGYAYSDFVAPATGNAYVKLYNHLGTPIEYDIEIDKVPCSHVSSDWIVDEAATCTQKGEKHTECELCGAVLDTETISMLPHEAYWKTTVEPTCLESGTKVKKCKICKKQLGVKTIPATGHIYSSWIIDKAATVNAAGKKHQECTSCGKVLKNAVISQLKPGTPKVSSVVNAASGIKITWGKVSGADKYRVYRRIKGGSWEIVGDTTSTSIVDKKVKTGTIYYYTVKAFNEAGGGNYNKTGKEIRCVATPKLTKIANGNKYVQVTWSKVGGADGYAVYRKLSGDTKWTKIATVKGGTNLTYKDTKVSSGKVYTYTVIAYDGGTYSSYVSSGISIKYLAIPSLSKVTSSKNGVTFTWGKVTGASGYVVYRKTGSGSWQQIATVKGNTKVSYLDKTAKKGVTYTYTVRAYSGSYKSAYNTKGLAVKDKY